MVAYRLGTFFTIFPARGMAEASNGMKGQMLSWSQMREEEGILMDVTCERYMVHVPDKLLAALWGR